MAVLSLAEALAQIPDTRHRRGLRHPLPAILSLAVVAILAGHHGPQAIAKFGRDRGKGLAHALGFRRAKTPAQSTLSEVFRSLDIAGLEQALSRWIAARQQDAGWQAIALDGKTLKGSADGQAPGVHLLAAYAPAASAVLAQMRVDAKTNEHKAALVLLGVLPLAGKVVTGDAMFAQKEVAETIRGRGGDYVQVVKGNQPGLKEDIQAALHDSAAFSPSEGKRREHERQEARTAGKGHGRLEVRKLRSTTMLAGWLDWPDCCQAFEIVRTRVVDGKRTTETAYGITSLSRREADAARLLELVRGHWGIENCLHWVRDVTMGEDASRVRKGGAAQVLAALRNTINHLLGEVEGRSKAEAKRHLANHSDEAEALFFSA